MAKRILVPLDLGERAEFVIPFAAALAKSGGATVRLLHVSPVPEARVTEDHRVVATADQEMERLLAKADDYLRMREMHFEGVPVESLVRFGRPAPEILVEAETFGADLITMTRPEGRWLKQGLFGGVAAQVFRQSRVPVLLYRGRG